MNLLDIIKQSGLKLGFQKLLDKQVEGVSSFVNDNDVPSYWVWKVSCICHVTICVE